MNGCRQYRIVQLIDCLTNIAMEVVEDLFTKL